MDTLTGMSISDYLHLVQKPTGLELLAYDGGDVLCPSAEYSPDADCGIQFNLSIDILDPNLTFIRVIQAKLWRGRH